MRTGTIERENCLAGTHVPIPGIVLLVQRYCPTMRMPLIVASISAPCSPGVERLGSCGHASPHGV